MAVVSILVDLHSWGAEEDVPIMETTEIARELDLCPAFMNAVLPLPSKVSMRPASNASLSCDKQLLPFPLLL